MVAPQFVPTHAPQFVNLAERKTERVLQRTLIVGAGDGGKLLVGEMRRNPSLGLRPVAFVDDNPDRTGATVESLEVWGGTHDIPAIVERHHIGVIVIAIPSAPEFVRARIRDVACSTSAQVLEMPHFGALLRGQATTMTLRGAACADVLGRSAVAADVDRCREFVGGRRVLITGAAGSIGQELALQVAQLGPDQVIALDINETGLFDLQHEIARRSRGVDFRPVVASVTNERRMTAILDRFRPEIVFHAAAYKHVPMMEEQPEEAVLTNAIGTYIVARAAANAGVDRFVLVSTDKAVRPSSVMGATKRVAELAIKSVARETGLSACCVRFGNVLGSRGSVIPTFERQIDMGGPVTVTDPRMMRFFMTIPEAVGLIVEAGALGDPEAIYMLDMGEEVSILQLAERLIRLRGLRPRQDIKIVFTGLRPGEKLSEELALQSEIAEPTEHTRIRRLTDAVVPFSTAFGGKDLAALRNAAELGDAEELREMLFAMVATADGCGFGEGYTEEYSLQMVG